MLVVPSIICENIVFIYIRNTLSLKIDFFHPLLIYPLRLALQYRQIDAKLKKKIIEHTILVKIKHQSDSHIVTSTLYQRSEVRFYGI